MFNREKEKASPLLVSLDVKPPYPAEVAAKQYPPEYKLSKFQSLMLQRQHKGVCGFLHQFHGPFRVRCEVVSLRVLEISTLNRALKGSWN